MTSAIDDTVIAILSRLQELDQIDRVTWTEHEATPGAYFAMFGPNRIGLGRQADPLVRSISLMNTQTGATYYTNHDLQGHRFTSYFDSLYQSAERATHAYEEAAAFLKHLTDLRDQTPTR